MDYVMIFFWYRSNDGTQFLAFSWSIELTSTTKQKPAYDYLSGRKFVGGAGDLVSFLLNVLTTCIKCA